MAKKVSSNKCKEKKVKEKKKGSGKRRKKYISKIQ